MRYKRSAQYRNADPSVVKQFVGLKSKTDEGRAFRTDEHDARMIVANLRKREHEPFKQSYKAHPYSSFRMLQDFESKRKKRR